MQRRRDIKKGLKRLNRQLRGELEGDRLARLLYAQDASVYEKKPLGVAYPRNGKDLEHLVTLASLYQIPLIPRGGGTSLAGQCVGDGLVVDTTRHMTGVLDYCPEDQTIRVQPGLTLGDLNRYVADDGLMFGPDTSTADQCTIGGMIGNNSCGAHSIYYGTTRDHVRRVGTVFADGVYERIGQWTAHEYRKQLERSDRLGEGLRALERVVSGNEDAIREAYPSRDVVRRNTGYPLDDFADRVPRGDRDGSAPLLPRFLCGTEGTLGFVADATLNLVERPGAKALVCAHFETLGEALEATVETVEHDPAAVEVVDAPVLEETKHHPEQRKNRFFIEGDPGAVLVIEFYAETEDQIDASIRELTEHLEQRDYGYAYPVVKPPDDKRVWKLRKAGLGLLMGKFGDVKPATVVEDTAVSVRVLPDYIEQFSEIMDRHGTDCVYYGHASVGELHLRPELNLKDPSDLEKFKDIARDVTELVRDYDGALSGEHGDGRVRSPLLEEFFGEQIMECHREIKDAFDPDRLLNPGKIVDPEPIDGPLRVRPGEPMPEVETVFDWSSDGGLLRAVEKCNGAGVCRKRAGAGGTMCPSYMATGREMDTTRGRANVFRQALYQPDPTDAFDDDELHEALDLCLSCKGCQNECPANVDMARMKAEFQQQYFDENGTPISARLFGHYKKLAELAQWAPGLVNFIMSLWIVRWFLEKVAGISRQRQLPEFAKTPFRSWFDRRDPSPVEPEKPVWLYIDPFTNYVEPQIGKAAVKVLEATGHRVELLPIEDDGRTLISKGLVREASKLTNENLERLEDLLERHPERPVVGLEPSALLTFCDETPDLAASHLQPVAEELGRRAELFEPFLLERLEAIGTPEPEWEGPDSPVTLHRHCHEKAIVDTDAIERALERAGYDVTELDTGCCGMAGSFGYEDQHQSLSFQIGELKLFPALREDTDSRVAASGTSCRHQIADGVGRDASHPVVLLADALPG